MRAGIYSGKLMSLNSMLILMTKVQLHLNSGLCESSACYYGTDHVEQNPQLHSACMSV